MPAATRRIIYHSRHPYYYVLQRPTDFATVFAHVLGIRGGNNMPHFQQAGSSTKRTARDFDLSTHT